MDAVFGDQSGQDEFALIDELSRASGVPVPKAVEEIRNAKVLHTKECDVEQMEDTVAGILGL